MKGEIIPNVRLRERAVSWDVSGGAWQRLGSDFHGDCGRRWESRGCCCWEWLLHGDGGKSARRFGGCVENIEFVVVAGGGASTAR